MTLQVARKAPRKRVPVYVPIKDRPPMDELKRHMKEMRTHTAKAFVLAQQLTPRRPSIVAKLDEMKTIVADIQGRIRKG
jgi:hypothetical protein